jgi:hypothetical protein
MPNGYDFTYAECVKSITYGNDFTFAEQVKIKTNGFNFTYTEYKSRSRECKKLTASYLAEKWRVTVR